MQYIKLSLGIFWAEFGFNEDLKAELEQLFWFKDWLIFGKYVGAVMFFHNLEK